jgi:hypothetical protein
MGLFLTQTIYSVLNNSDCLGDQQYPPGTQEILHVFLIKESCQVKW